MILRKFSLRLSHNSFYLMKSSILALFCLFLTSACFVFRSDGDDLQLIPDTTREAFLFEEEPFYPALYQPKYTLRDLAYITTRRNDSIFINFGGKSMKGKIELFFTGKLHHDPVLKTKVNNGVAVIPVKDIQEIVYGLDTDVFTLSFLLYDPKNTLITAGKQAFFTEPRLQPTNTITYGPEVITRTDRTIELGYVTSEACSTIVWHNGISNTVEPKTQNHRISIDRFRADSTALIEIEVDGRRFPFSFPPYKSEKEPVNILFTAHTGADRKKGSDQDYFRKIGDYAYKSEVDLVIFGGNFSGGPFEDQGEADADYRLHRFFRDEAGYRKPVYTMLGKKEFVKSSFITEDKRRVYGVNKSPVYTASSEAVFSRVFDAPTVRLPGEQNLKRFFNRNEPHAEYQSTAFAFRQQHVGVVVLNTEYARTSNWRFSRAAGGSISGYLLENQISWLKRQLEAFEKNNAISNVVIFMHSPLYPTGEYISESFWYGGKFRAAPKGKNDKDLPGVIAVRDELMETFSANEKVTAIVSAEPGLNGILNVSADSSPYPAGFNDKRIILREDILLMNFGGRGQNLSINVPWSNDAVVLKENANGMLLSFPTDKPAEVSFFEW